MNHAKQYSLKKKATREVEKNQHQQQQKFFIVKLPCEGFLISSSLKSLIQSSCLTDIQSLDLHCLKKKKGTPNK